MTTFERTKQNLSVFEHAGRTAFLMLILKADNPYPKFDKYGVPEPANLAWDRGYDAEAGALADKTRAAKTPAPRKPYPFKRPIGSVRHNPTSAKRAATGPIRTELGRKIRAAFVINRAGFVGHGDRSSGHVVPVEVTRGK